MAPATRHSADRNTRFADAGLTVPEVLPTAWPILVSTLEICREGILRRQAIQNINLMFGLPETAGLEQKKRCSRSACPVLSEAHTRLGHASRYTRPSIRPGLHPGLPG